MRYLDGDCKHIGAEDDHDTGFAVEYSECDSEQAADKVNMVALMISMMVASTTQQQRMSLTIGLEKLGKK